MALAHNFLGRQFEVPSNAATDPPMSSTDPWDKPCGKSDHGLQRIEFGRCRSHRQWLVASTIIPCSFSTLRENFGSRNFFNFHVVGMGGLLASDGIPPSHSLRTDQDR
jgi:hypothetical protein